MKTQLTLEELAQQNAGRNFTNMKTQPTNGPWFVMDEGSQIVIQTFAEHPSGTIARIYGSDELARADARLIAAAPELLQALRGLVDAFDGTTDCTEILDMIGAPDSYVRQVIANATTPATKEVRA